MPIDYTQIARDNERKYGTEIDNYGPKLLADSYSDPAHFVFELLQNAEDALGERIRLKCDSTLPRAAKFLLFEDRLEFRHYGIPFAENHAQAICDIARSSKQETPGAIGHFGIGFKSVFAFTRSPEVHSCGESFVIKSLVRPAAIAKRPTQEGETLFVLPFNHTESSLNERMAERLGELRLQSKSVSVAELCHRIIAKRLRELGQRTLLFLRRLDEIDWKIERGGVGRYLRESKKEAERVERITLVGEDRGKATMEEHWLVFSQAVRGENGTSGIVEIAYQLQQTKEKRRGQIRRIKDSPLCVYFATDLQTNLGFLVQGPFHLTQNRDNIRREDKWNTTLAKEVGKLTAESLSNLKEMGLLSISALDALPLEKEPFETETGKLFLPVYEAVLQALTKRALIPGIRKEFVSGAIGVLVRGRELADLFKPEQLKLLLGSEEERRWISPDITADKKATQDLHTYLWNAVEVEQVDADVLGWKLHERFLKVQKEEWFVRFYRFLLKHGSLWTERGVLREKPIIRLADGSNVSPFGHDGAANAFLPTGDEIGPKTVHPKLSKGDALVFLQKLGIRERDSVAEVLEDILPLYEAGGAPTERKHERNLRRIFRALSHKESPDHPVLLEKLKQTAFLRATNAKTGKRGWQSPSALLYFKISRLEDYFQGDAGAWFLAEPALSQAEKSRHWLALLGVADEPSVLSGWEGAEAVEKRHRERIETGGRFESSDNYNIHGLENVLKRIRKLAHTAPKEAGKLSKLLWDFLSGMTKAEGENLLFEGSLRWKKFHHKRVEEESIDAYFVECLRGTAWLPDRKGQFRKPGEMQATEMASGFEQNSKLCEAMQFQKPWAEKVKEHLTAKQIRLLELAELYPEAEEEFQRNCKKRSASPTAATAEQKGIVNSVTVDGVSRSESSKTPAGRTESATIIEPEATGIPTAAKTQSASDVCGLAVEVVEQKGDRTPRTDHLQTRVRVVAETAGESTSETQEMSEFRIRIGQAGIAAVKAFEQKAGRTVIELPHNHEGYDLKSRGQADEILRYIEVKATGSDWLGVLLSAPQFRAAQRLGDRYWLYVVENADSATPSVYPIQNPAALTEKFIFDHGWKEISTAQNTLP